MPKLINLVGDTYSLLTVISQTPSNYDGSRWYCQCACGKFVVVSSKHLRQFKTRSCGCLKNQDKIKHGETKKTKEYRAWLHMKNRCLNKRDKRYEDWGGRGVKICDLWIKSYSSFLNDVGRAPSPTHSLDRIENTGNYEPGNVKWSTDKEQSNNRRPRRYYRNPLPV